MEFELASLAPAAMAAAALFTLTWIVLGRVSTGFTLFGTRIAPYDWIAQPVSGLGLGPTAWLMNAVFVVTAALLALGIVGTLASLPVLPAGELRILGAILLLSPLGFAMCGIFNLERMLLHSIGYFVGMVAPVIGFASLGWRLGRHQAYEGLGLSLIVASVVTLVLLIVFIRSFDPESSGRGQGIGGLTQRLLITEVLSVFALLAWAASHGAAP